MAEPIVSIIIVNFSGKIFLKSCLDSLSNITFLDYEIIVVDNNSNDDSVSFLKKNYPKISLIELERNYGFAFPNNLAAKRAKGRYLLFLNNDTEVTSSFLESMLKQMESNENIGICQSLLLKPDGSVDSSGDFVDLLGIPFSTKEFPKTVKKILSAKGASMLVRKKVFEKLGMFDEKFVISFEDVDLGWRCWIYGFEVILVPDSIVYHKGGKTISKKDINVDLDFHGAKNHLIIKLTNFEGKSILNKIFFFLIIYGFRQLHVWLDYKIKGKTKVTTTRYETKISKKPNIRAILRALIWILQNKSYLKNRMKTLSLNRKYSSKYLEQQHLIFQPKNLNI